MYFSQLSHLHCKKLFYRGFSIGKLSHYKTKRRSTNSVSVRNSDTYYGTFIMKATCTATKENVLPPCSEYSVLYSVSFSHLETQKHNFTQRLSDQCSHVHSHQTGSLFQHTELRHAVTAVPRNLVLPINTMSLLFPPKTSCMIPRIYTTRLESCV